MSNTGGPAFPVYPRHEGGTMRQVEGAVGMSLRDYLAAKAMAAMIASPHFNDETQQITAAHAYSMASAMLAERAKEMM